jgi:ribosomal protein S18 acetylase RimI-like enzyme
MGVIAWDQGNLRCGFVVTRRLPRLPCKARFCCLRGFLRRGSFGIVETMATRIRPASASDREQILALAPRLTDGVAEWRDPRAVRRGVTGWVQDSLDGSNRHDQAVLVADRDGAVCGFVSVGMRKHWSGDLDGYIGELVVSHEAEGAGIGSDLIRAAIEWSREQELDRVSVDTGAANTRARDLYRKLGFSEESITFSIATDQDSTSTD